MPIDLNAGPGPILRRRATDTLDPKELFAGDGEMARLTRSKDWAATALGPVERWPDALWTTVQMLLKSRHPMFLWWGPELIQFYNDAYLPSFGKGKHPNALGQRGEECWPEIWPTIGPQIEDVMQRGKPSWHEDQLVPIYRNGRLEDVYWTYGYSPVYVRPGTIGGTLVVCTETTRRIVSDRALRASEDRLRRVIEASGAHAWEVDLVTGKVTADPALLALFGLPPAPHALEAVLDRIHPEDLDRALATMESALRREREGRLLIEHRVTDAATGERWLEGRGQVFFDSAGRPVRFLGTARDVTERRRFEEEHKLSLERQAKLEQQLIGIVSHDLRNPLNAIVLNVAGLSRNEGLDDRASRFVLRIQSSAERARRMVMDLLDFTRARLGGGISIERAPTELHALVRQVVDELQVAHPGRQVHLQLEGEGDGAWDGDRLAQVIANLVTNALKYSPEDSPVRVVSRVDDGWVTLSVHNVGVPIPPGQLSQIFDPMQRATAEIDRAGRSVGLGLYIVKHLVDAHQGTIAVQSTAAEGTTFTVRLPRKPTH